MLERIKQLVCREPNESKRQLAPFFKERLKKHTDIRDGYRSGGERWSFMRGEYIYPFFFDTEEGYRRIPDEKLLGTEKVLCSLALELAIRTQEGNTSILIDFGGMYSLSFLYLARQKAVKQFIEEGKLALVVSNLGFTPEAGLARNGMPFHEYSRFDFHTLSEEEVQLVTDTKKYIHYVLADAQELLEMTIQVHGKKVPIRGNVGLIHEQNTLMHGWVNDRDLSILGELLFADGCLCIGSKELTPDRQDYETILRRTTAHEMAWKRLVHQGLEELIIPDRRMMYRVFTNSNGRTIFTEVLKRY